MRPMAPRAFICSLAGPTLSADEERFLRRAEPWGLILFTRNIESPAATVKSNIPGFESILDKFIRDNPSISRPKADFYSAVDVAKQSVEEDDDLVTETLADIYYKQGAWKKAIKAYEKLCLIYPHKMSYFAALIQEIDNHLNKLE